MVDETTSTGRSAPVPLAAAREVGSTCFCFNLRRAARLVTQVYSEALRPLGLQATQFTLLMAIHGRGPIPMRRLAGAVGMDRTTLTRNLQVLQQRGWVVVEPGEDRRVRELSLSDEGSGVLGRAYPLWREAQASLAQRLGSHSQPLLDELSRATRAVGEVLEAR